MPPPPRTPLRWLLPAIVTVLVLGFVGLGSAAVVEALLDDGPEDTTFADLDPTRSVYAPAGPAGEDPAAVVVPPDLAADLTTQVDRVREVTGLGLVVVVRPLRVARTASEPQAEALLDRWVEVGGADPRRAGALVVNLDTDPRPKRDRSRGALALGPAYDAWSLDARRDLVGDLLLSAVRDDRVAEGLTRTVDALARDLETGPDRNPLERLADGPGETWLPWLLLAAAGAVACAVGGLVRGRLAVLRRGPAPTTVRPPDGLPLAVGGALARGRVDPRTVLGSALLDLGARGVVAIEPHDPPSRASPRGTASLRLLDPAGLRGPVERDLWDHLAAEKVGGRVLPASLRVLATRPHPLSRDVEDHLRRHGWLRPHDRTRPWLRRLAAACLALALVSVVVGDQGGAAWLPLGFLLFGVLGALALASSFVVSDLTRTGQDAAAPWRAYRRGVAAGANHLAGPLGAALRTRLADLDSFAPDLVALGQADNVSGMVVAAIRDGARPRALALPGRPDDEDLHEDERTAALWVGLLVACDLARSRIRNRPAALLAGFDSRPGAVAPPPR